MTGDYDGMRLRSTLKIGAVPLLLAASLGVAALWAGYVNANTGIRKGRSPSEIEAICRDVETQKIDLPGYCAFTRIGREIAYIQHE